MKIAAGLSISAWILFSTIACAADLRARPTTVGQSTTTIQFSVPYSFTNVRHELDHAVIRCVVQDVPKTPPVGAGQTTIMLQGQPKSGTAVIHVAPLSGQTLAGAKHYSCEMQVSNGKMTVVPQPTGFDWARIKSGSTVMVGGQIK